MNPQKNSDKYVNPLRAMQQNEQEIFAIKRHPIGIISTYIVAGFTLVVLAVIIFGLAPFAAPDHRSQIIRLGAGLYLIILLVTLLMVVVAHYVYWNNRWVLTSDSLTQVTQTGLFDKESSQLSLANLEDVTARTNGMLAKMFNFGVLKVETAGERSKFTFNYCPNPEKYAQLILGAREQFEQGLRQQDVPPAQQTVAPQSTQLPPSAPAA